MLVIAGNKNSLKIISDRDVLVYLTNETQESGIFITIIHSFENLKALFKLFKMLI